MKYYLLLFLTSVFLFLPPAALSAKTAYVSDELQIMMRTGKGTDFKINKVLSSGTKVNVLEESDGYSRVRIEEGAEGWVLTRLLQNTPVAKIQLVKVQKELDDLKERSKNFLSELEQLKNEREQLSQSEHSLKIKNQRLVQELEKLQKIAARPMQLEAENEQLRKELVESESEMTLVKQEYQTLEGNREQEWFITGAGVLFGGMILGLIFPKLRAPQRKTNWNRL